MAWTKERLEESIRERIGGAKLIVVANREPYIHRHRNGGIECLRPAGGLTTALDPVMRACGGVWVGHGSGDADRETADAFGRVAVPPHKPSYNLRRVWLTPEQEAGYYYGFANDALWPLCHQVYQRPTFNSANWQTYREVNELFARAVLEEAEGGPALVFVQDYHFALLPRMLKDARPDLTIAQFWHIPWPNPETFRVCPWGPELLDGLLGNDLLAFHIQYHCNNFLETVDRTLESRICRERFNVTRGGHDTRVRPFPISIDANLAKGYLDGWENRIADLRIKHRLCECPLIVGADRVDYTKGIPERLLAVERLLERQPELIGQFHFFQIGAPSRTTLPAYRRLNDEIADITARINFRFAAGPWRPIVFHNEHAGPEEIFALYRAATACAVTSLHDGMNLVAKEFISARDDERGSLILSRFTGAARELSDAVQVNPFDIDGIADAYFTALNMPEEEQTRRMRRMRAHVEDHNIYRWAGTLLSQACKLVDDVPNHDFDTPSSLESDSSDSDPAWTAPGLWKHPA